MCRPVGGFAFMGRHIGVAGADCPPVRIRRFSAEQTLCARRSDFVGFAFSARGKYEYGQRGNDQATGLRDLARSEENTYEIPSIMRISYDVFCLKKKKNKNL